jgi:hypothetical protein
MEIGKLDASNVGSVVMTVVGWVAFGALVCIGWQIGLKLWGAF